MTDFYVVKTGLPVYDWSRAYGLAIVVESLGGDATLQDVGPFFLITGKDPNVADSSRLHSHLGDDLSWTEPLITRQNAAPEIAKSAQNRLSNPDVLSRIVERHRTRHLEAIRGTATLYHGMEPAAAKGFREPVLGRTYGEGSQLSVPEEEWHLSLLGHANVSAWCFGKSQRLCIVPVIKLFHVKHLKQVREALRETRYINGAGAEVTVAEKSCRLYAKILESQDEDFRGRARFDAMLSYTLAKTANQWKPGTVFTYPLALVNKISSGSSSLALEALWIWSRILRAGNRKGWEAIALSLARVISNPTHDAWQRYVSTHIRYARKKDFHVYYESDVMTEVLRWVET